MRTLFILLACCILVGTVAAADVGEYRAITCKGALNLLVPLGFEQLLPAAAALWCYNFMSIGMLFLLAAASGERNTRHFVVLLPLMAAIFVFFGWLQAPNPTTTWSIIIGAGLLGGMVYMKESLRENWGIGGPGETLLNIAFYLILLQCVIGVVNGSGIFDSNLTSTPAEYQSVDLSAQISSIGDTGGFLGDVQSVANILFSMGIGALRVVIQIVMSIVLSSVVIVHAFPFIGDSPFALAILVAFNLVEWLLFAMLALNWYYFKNSYATGV